MSGDDTCSGSFLRARGCGKDTEHPTSPDMNARARLCAVPGCSTLVVNGSLCDRHREVEPGGAGLSAAQSRMAQARQRLTRAKSAWTACAVAVLRREPGAGERVADCVAELQSAQDALDPGRR